MISERLQEAINEQVKRELYSAYLYLAMSAYSAGRGWSGTAGWFRAQYNEEVEHAMKMFDYILQQGGEVHLRQIDEPAKEFGEPRDLFKKALEHEQFVTSCIDELMNLAVEEKSHATQVFLQWYVTEQVEEEASVQEVLDYLDMAGDHRGAFLMLDNRLGQRLAGRS